MNIAVVGTGYVGLVTGTCFSELGNHVPCIDIDENKVNRLKTGKIPIYEPGLEVLFQQKHQPRATYNSPPISDRQGSKAPW